MNFISVRHFLVPPSSRLGSFSFFRTSFIFRLSLFIFSFRKRDGSPTVWHESNHTGWGLHVCLVIMVIKDFASGEIKQASSLFDCDVKLEDYLLKSYNKTASLITARTKGVAIFSGAGRSVTE
ncbi:hypothetical protein J1N35_013074 [Gossypium stocksii]|uniref:Uncharacterized protein n=1 Tax=Gossypium stocksii TaxID=47602 RepID=A0A9D4A6C5_9ROSI|nr:hypothetical protein J1N35_013074 [Gossypium stocksii]